MKLDDFWDLIHRSAVATTSRDERTAWLTTQLAQSPVADIVGFELHLMAEKQRVDTRLMWGAAWNIMKGWCSDDSFWYFQPWLVGLGRDAFDRVAADPDTLAELKQIHRLATRPRSDWFKDEWPQWELLNYVAVEAHELATGQEHGLNHALEAQGLRPISSPAPKDERWDYDDTDQVRSRLPHLATLLG